MRVIHLIGGGDTGGAKTHVLNLLKELNRFIDAQLFCFRKGDFSADAEKMGIPIHVIETGDPIRGLAELKKQVAGQKIDIIHCHGARGNLMGNLLKKFVNAPVVTTVHSDYRLDYLGRPVARLSYGTTNLVALRRVNYYIGVCDNISEILIERKFPADRIETIYNGIDFKTPISYLPKEEFLRSIGFPYAPGDVIAGIVGRLTPVKDIPTLLKAMKKARTALPNLKLAIAGDGEDREKLEQLTRQLGLEDAVCFTGWLKDINSFYNAIDLSLITSLSEGFPYVLTEAARMRKAVISTHVGGIPALIKDGDTGLLFTPQDVDRLAELLAELAQDPEKRREMGNRLYEKASRELSIDSMVERQMEIYNNILQREARQLTHKRDGVVICGAYGHGNAGDEAILKSIIHSVRELDRFIPITVLAKSPQSIKKRYRVNSVYTFNLPKILRAMHRSRLYINGGGTLIQNATSHRSLWYYLMTLRAAKFLGNQVDMYGCGIGPVAGKKNVNLVRRVLDSSVDMITLREPDSLRELTGYGVSGPQIRLSSDPALVLPPAGAQETERFLQSQGLDPKGKYICFLLRSWPGFGEKAPVLARCAEEARARYGLEPVFISINPFQDEQAAKLVLEHMELPGRILDRVSSPELLISILSHMSVAVSMRLHGLIFSSLSGTPLVGVSYDPKIGSYLRYLGYGECVDLKDLTGDWLMGAIERAYAQLPRREELRAKTRRLSEVERENIAAVRNLIK